MPKYWYNRSSNSAEEFPDEEERKFNLRILADKKPYFMRYIYPNLMSQYRNYIKNTDKKCLREFRITMDELLSKDRGALTEREREFLFWYYEKMPVGIHDCVMNRICRRFEEEFDHYLSKYKKSTVPFDYTILKSGAKYRHEQFLAVEKVVKAYNKRVREFMQVAKMERIDEGDVVENRAIMVSEFRSDCERICSNGAQLCDILVDLCYRKEGSKQIVWDIVGEEVVENLLRRNGGRIAFPTRDDDGGLVFGGERFSVTTWKIREGERDGDHIE